MRVAAEAKPNKTMRSLNQADSELKFTVKSCAIAFGRNAAPRELKSDVGQETVDQKVERR